MYTILPQTGDGAAIEGLGNALIGIGNFLLFLSCAFLVAAILIALRLVGNALCFKKAKKPALYAFVPFLSEYTEYDLYWGNGWIAIIPLICSIAISFLQTESIGFYVIGFSVILFFHVFTIYKFQKVFPFKNNRLFWILAIGEPLLIFSLKLVIDSIFEFFLLVVAYGMPYEFIDSLVRLNLLLLMFCKPILLFVTGLSKNISYIPRGSEQEHI